jgi:hypothetical protein
MITYRGSFVVASITAAALLATVPTPARAQGGSCADDTARLCSHVKEGGGARIRCLQEHEGQLTPDCRRDIEHMEHRASEVSQACSDDAARLCSNVESGKGRVVSCLANHEAQLTADCRAEVSRARSDINDAKQNAKEKVEDKKDDIQAACSGDISRHCNGVEPGHGNILRCLNDHEGALTPGCRAALH